MDAIFSKEVVSAFIGAAATIIAVWLAVYLGLKRLKDTETKRLRIKCVTDLIAFRFVIVAGSTSSEARINFLAALNGVVGLFGDSASIMRLLRDFRELTDVNAKNLALIQLIRATADISGVPMEHVSDVELMTPFN